MFFLITFICPLVSVSQSFKGMKDTIPNETIHITERFHFELKEFPIIISLPKEICLNSDEGTALIVAWFDTLGGPYWHTLLFLSLRENDQTIIRYVSDLKNYDFENPNSFEVEDFPLPIQPYILFFKEKLNELEFIENKDIPKKNFYYNIPFTIKNKN